MDRLFYDIDQGSDEWFALRFGKATASNFASIMAHNGKPFGEPAKKYAMKMVVEEATQRRIPSYTNDHMERGIELEPIAQTLYPGEVKNGGFMGYGAYGASSDGLVGDDGMIEIKSVIFSTHFKRLLEGGYDTAYQWQIQGNLWIYDRKWLDFVSYCPDFPTNKQLYTFRVERDDEKIKSLKTRLNEFMGLVEEYKYKITGELPYADDMGDEY